MGQNGRVDKTTHLAWLEQYAGQVDLMDQLSFNGSCSKHVKLEGAVKAHESLLSVADSVSEKARDSNAAVVISWN